MKAETQSTLKKLGHASRGGRALFFAKYLTKNINYTNIILGQSWGDFNP